MRKFSRLVGWLTVLLVLVFQGATPVAFSHAHVDATHGHGHAHHDHGHAHHGHAHHGHAHHGHEHPHHGDAPAPAGQPRPQPGARPHVHVWLWGVLLTMPVEDGRGDESAVWIAVAGEGRPGPRVAALELGQAAPSHGQAAHGGRLATIGEPLGGDRRPRPPSAKLCDQARHARSGVQLF